VMLFRTISNPGLGEIRRGRIPIFTEAQSRFPLLNPRPAAAVLDPGASVGAKAGLWIEQVDVVNA
jgi:hypothetical protein